MDLFVGAVNAGAETAMFPRTGTGDSTEETVIADYQRPAAVNSDDLDNPGTMVTRSVGTQST